MNRELVVIVGGVVAGTLVRQGRRALRFDYDEEYLRQPDPTPLSVSMLTAVKSHADEVVSPWLWGLLPDNPSVLGRWARAFQVPSSSPVALLGSPIGGDCAGAVRFAPQDQLADFLSARAEVAWLSDDEVGQRLRELRQDATAWLGREPESRFGPVRRPGQDGPDAPRWPLGRASWRASDDPHPQAGHRRHDGPRHQ